MMIWSPWPVLPITVVYADGSTLDGWLSRDGKILVHVPAPAPPAPEHFDATRSLLRLGVPASQGLTLTEARSGERGTVRRADGLPDRFRSAGYAKREGPRGVDVVLLERAGRREEVLVGIERIRENGPGLYEELRWRNRRRYTKESGAIVQVFLKAMVERARVGDAAARFAIKRGWREGLPAVEGVLRGVVGSLGVLKEKEVEAEVEAKIEVEGEAEE